ncbi:hypothetical protein SB822_39870, partial [Paraburkholderia sp. SIMBA_054]
SLPFYFVPRTSFMLLIAPSIYVLTLTVQVLDLAFFAASPQRVASYPLPVRQASALPRTSFRLAVARETLASG